MTTTQQISPNPAIDFAQSILDVTNNGLELIEILRDIAEDEEKANTNDRITAADTLMDRVFGKRPRQLYPNPGPAPSTEPVLSTVEGSEPDPESAESDNHANHSSDISRSGSESPRLVTQISNSLNDTLGPAPTAPQPVGAGLVPAQPAFDSNSIHLIIQQHILDITKNGQTLRDALLKIARTEDDPKVTSYHRRRATGILIDRALGTDPNALGTAAFPDSSSQPEPNPVVEEEPIDDKVWEEIIAEINQLEADGVITPDPNAPKIDRSAYMKWTDEEIAPYAEEAAARFDAKIALRVERQKAWPAIEERRRKKLEQIYPSHSEDDGDPPDT